MVKWRLVEDAHDNLILHAYLEERNRSAALERDVTTSWHAASIHIEMLGELGKEITDIIETGGTPVLKLTVDAE